MRTSPCCGAGRARAGRAGEVPLAALRARGGEFVGELETYSDVFRLCYVRGPAGIIVEPAERIG